MSKLTLKKIVQTKAQNTKKFQRIIIGKFWVQEIVILIMFEIPDKLFEPWT